MIEPKPPPAAIPRTSSSTPSVPFAAPPEKITMRRPAKALCTTWRDAVGEGADRDLVGFS
jgi:hypothetical protein